MVNDSYDAEVGAGCVPLEPEASFWAVAASGAKASAAATSKEPRRGNTELKDMGIGKKNLFRRRSGRANIIDTDIRPPEKTLLRLQQLKPLLNQTTQRYQLAVEKMAGTGNNDYR